ncbi:MAG: SCO1664 family protein [Actinomycetota bacterium]
MAAAADRMVVLGALRRASNATLLVRLGEEEDAPLAIYKPRAGERPLWDFPDGTLCAREVAASLVARELGWPTIPTTVLAEGPYGEGSLQDFVAFDPDQHFFTLREEHDADLRRLAAFDVVVNNADRKGGHVLLADEGIVAIDHGLCFHVETKLRTVIWDFAGEPLPDGVPDDLRRLDAALADGALRADLDALLAAEEIEATRARIGDLLAAGVYPMPDEEGLYPPYPWPPL